MIGFLLKKTFFDIWDNLFRIALINLGFIISAAIPILVPTVLVSVPALAITVMVLGVLWCFVYLAAAATVLRTVSDYGAFGFRDFFDSISDSWLAGLVLGIIALAMGIFAYTALPFYLSMHSLIGIFAAALVFWTLVIVVLAFQFYLAIRARLDRDLRKVIKKSFIIFFDNPGLAIFSLFHNLVLLVLSFFLAFLAPGPAGILLYLDEALRLRLLKYDWLEANPDANRRKIPWDAILVEEREKTGSRSLRNFIFPWKD
ncbi:hypothetical protein MASR2M78_24930 [Treponema sp.]